MHAIFSQNPLNRLDHLRGNDDDFTHRKQHKDSVFLLFADNDILVDSQGNCLFNNQDLQTLNLSTINAIMLGELDNITHFALSTSTTKLQPTSLRDFAVKNPDMSGIFAQAAAVLNWHKSHTHCACCGIQTQITHSGWRRDCKTCGVQHFPRTDPVVIMLVTYKDECLLGRGHHFEENRYSCLAGFVESGETLEAAAKRELFEEAGIIGGETNYIMSQPWPFPSNLMVGMHIQAKAQNLTIDTIEIADAIWVKKSAIKRALEGDTSLAFTLPPNIAIARNLLEFWVNSQKSD